MKSNINIYLEALKKEILPNNKRSNFLIRILESAINNPLSKGPNVDFHHIMPHSWGGPNNKENLVPLLKGHHFKVHQLLSEVTIDKDKKSSMHSAYWRMCNCGKYKIKNHKEYERFQEEYSKIQSEKMKEWRNNMSEEEKADIIRKTKETKNNKSLKEKQEWKNNVSLGAKDWWNNLTIEEVNSRGKNHSKILNDMPEEDKIRWSNNLKKSIEKRSKEEKENIKKNKQNTWSKKSKEEKISHKEKISIKLKGRPSHRRTQFTDEETNFIINHYKLNNNLSETEREFNNTFNKKYSYKVFKNFLNRK